MASPFLDSVRRVIRSKYYSIKTERTYLYWIVAYIRFHGNKHPEQLGEADIRHYLTHLAIEGNVSPSTQKTALNALVFMYRHFVSRCPALAAKADKPGE
ncbi:site-specific integrase [Marinimicrobium locisalis]|uniref:site-specific integrase n=1 Tax=Marinimicrobium locisalis TaxID=546022 RepID=UPI003221EBBD